MAKCCKIRVFVLLFWAKIFICAIFYAFFPSLPQNHHYDGHHHHYLVLMIFIGLRNTCWRTQFKLMKPIRQCLTMWQCKDFCWFYEDLLVTYDDFLMILWWNVWPSSSLSLPLILTSPTICCLLLPFKWRISSSSSSPSTPSSSSPPCSPSSLWSPSSESDVQWREASP